MYEYLTNCVDAKGSDIQEMVDQATKIPYHELANEVGTELLEQMFGTDVPLEKDWAVSFWKSEYLGDKVYYVDHSRIEYIFKEIA